MKRTTLVIEEGLLDGIRREAQRRECDLSTVVNDSLRFGLHRRDSAAVACAPLPAFDMGRPRVNVSDRDALEAVMNAR